MDMCRAHKYQASQAGASLCELLDRLSQFRLVACQAILILAGLDDALPGQDMAIEILDIDPGGEGDTEVEHQILTL